MGKNRSASGLTNVIQYDNNGNIAFVSGSTTLMQVSSSGAITTTGVISGSNALSASFSLNSALLNGTGSVGFATTGSLLTVSSSQQQISASLLQVSASQQQISASLLRISSSYASTGSNTFTAAQFISDTSNAISFTSTASLYSNGGLRVQGNSFVSGTAYFNNIVVYGTSSIQYITSSQVNVGSNIITVNTDTPSVRFGGLSVFDSGSTGLTGSIFWDSELNRWIYVNASGSGGGATYGGGMFISGPRNSIGLGCEQGTTACMLLVGQGGDHLTSSLVYHSSTCTNFYSSALFVSSSCSVGIGTNVPNASLHINGTPGQNNPSIRLTDSAASGNGGNVYISADKSGVGYNNLTTIAFSHTFKGGGSAANYLTIDSNGVSCFANTVCAPVGSFSGCIGIGTTPSYKLDVYRGSSGVVLNLQGVDAYDAETGILMTSGRAKISGFLNPSGGTPGSNLRFYTMPDGGSVTERLRITSDGIACFSSRVCAPSLTTTSGGVTQIQNGVKTQTFFAYKFINENSTAAFFRITTSGASSTHTQLAASNAGVGWYTSQIYHAGNAGYWGGYIGSGASISIAGGAAGYISGIYSDNAGAQNYCVTVASNGTSTQSFVVAYITVVLADGYGVTFTQL